MISRETLNKISHAYDRIDEAEYLLKNLEELEAAKINKENNGTIDYLGNKIRFVPFSVVKEMLKDIINKNKTELDLLEHVVNKEN